MFHGISKNLIATIMCHECSGVDTPTNNSPNWDEKTPLLGPNKYSIDVECENVSDDRAELDESEQHKAKDFQLIHVPKGAVSHT